MAILKRRRRQNLKTKVRQSLWPSMGWNRTFHYYRHRLFRTGDSTYKITAGLANGVAAVFSPFLGTQVIQAFLFSWLTRASYVAAFIGTAVGTPWTYPPIFIASYRVGVWVCGLFGLSDFVALPEEMIGEGMAERDLGAFASYVYDHPLKLLLPLTIGGYLCALLSWPFSYGLLYYPVHVARRTYLWRRLQRREKRLERRIKALVTGERDDNHDTRHRR